MGFFSRLAQATYLLGQAFDLLSSDSADATECLNANQGAQLRRTLQALVNIADEEASVRQLYICAQSMSCFRLEKPLPNLSSPADHFSYINSQ
jgi:hypothetical protein